MAALSLRASDELSHLGHRAASKDLVEVGPQSALHKVSEDTDPVARVREPWKPFREDVEVREVQRLAMTNSCGQSPTSLNHGRTETQNTILIILNRPRAYRPSAPVSFHCRAGPTTAPGGSRRASGQRCGGDPAFDTARSAYRTSPAVRQAWTTSGPRSVGIVRSESSNGCDARRPLRRSGSFRLDRNWIVR